MSNLLHYPEILYGLAGLAAICLALLIMLRNLK